MQIDLRNDDALKTAAGLYQQGRMHALQNESVDGIGFMIQALNYLEPMKGDSHRILRADCLYFMGMMEIGRGRYGTAHDSLDEATKLNPSVAVYWAFLSQACMKLGADRRAMQSAEAAAALGESNNIVFHMLQTIWEHYQDFAKAEYFARKAAEFTSEDPDAFYMLGNANYVKGNREEAAKWHKRALDAAPDHPDANYGYGLILSENLQFREAIPYFTRGAKSRMNQYESVWARAFAHLILGEYEQGWQDQEVRFLCMKQEYGIQLTEHRFDKPQWNGETQPSRIHVYSEQGFGDCLQYCRYVKLLCDMGHEVIFEIDASMQGLMKHNFPKANVVPVAKDYPGVHGIAEVDYRISLGSLPYAFKTRLETIPLSEGYLEAEPEKIEEWRIIKNGPGLMVGLCWAGGKRVQDTNLAAMDETRSIGFDRLRPVLDVPNVRFVSLQIGLAANQADESIYKTVNGIKSWSDTAAMIAHLDLVISVDTSVLHMAAAMGKPTWLLNKYSTCWRWLLERTDSPWYQSMRIFRPDEMDGWDKLIQDAREALLQWRR